MKFILFICTGLWICGIFTGSFLLMNYENTPADENITYPADFPAESKMTLSQDVPTLLFFVHPKCPCTRASLNELDRLIADVNGNLDIYLIFAKPSGSDEQWTKTDLREKAARLPNARIIIDENELETNIFNARTSGLVLLYDRAGRLRFNGGITSARGQEGDNSGRFSLFKIITGDLDEIQKVPVYGCPLQDTICRTGLVEK